MTEIAKLLQQRLRAQDIMLVDTTDHPMLLRAGTTAIVMEDEGGAAKTLMMRETLHADGQGNVDLAQAFLETVKAKDLPSVVLSRSGSL